MGTSAIGTEKGEAEVLRGGYVSPRSAQPGHQAPTPRPSIHPSLPPFLPACLLRSFGRMTYLPGKELHAQRASSRDLDTWRGRDQEKRGAALHEPRLSYGRSCRDRARSAACRHAHLDAHAATSGGGGVHSPLARCGQWSPEYRTRWCSGPSPPCWRNILPGNTLPSQAPRHGTPRRRRGGASAGSSASRGAGKGPGEVVGEVVGEGSRTGGIDGRLAELGDRQLFCRFLVRNLAGSTGRTESRARGPRSTSPKAARTRS